MSFCLVGSEMCIRDRRERERERQRERQRQRQRHLISSHLSLNRDGRWGTTDGYRNRFPPRQKQTERKRPVRPCSFVCLFFSQKGDWATRRWLVLCSIWSETDCLYKKLSPLNSIASLVTQKAKDKTRVVHPAPRPLKRLSHSPSLLKNSPVDLFNNAGLKKTLNIPARSL